MGQGSYGTINGIELGELLNGQGLNVPLPIF